MASPSCIPMCSHISKDAYNNHTASILCEATRQQPFLKLLRMRQVFRLRHYHRGFAFSNAFALNGHLDTCPNLKLASQHDSRTVQDSNLIPYYRTTCNEKPQVTHTIILKGFSCKGAAQTIANGWPTILYHDFFRQSNGELSISEINIQF